MIQFELRRVLDKVERPRNSFAVLMAELTTQYGAVITFSDGTWTCAIMGVSGSSADGEQAALADWARAARRVLLVTRPKFLILPAEDENLDRAMLQGQGAWPGMTEGTAYQVFELTAPLRMVPGEPAPILPPTVITAPTITGTPTVGQTLTATEGTWTGNPTLTLQWLRNGTAISGATGATYLLIAADAGANISNRVTATNAGGSTTATSAAVGPVEEDGPVSTLRPDLVWAFGDSKTAYTSDQTTVSTAPQNTKVGADGGWMAILESLENHRFTFVGKTAVGGWSSTDLAENVDAGIAAAIANGCGTATLLVGSNDMPGNTNPNANVPASLVSNVATIISKIQAAGMKIILMNEWPAAPNDGRTKLPLGNWYKAQQTANAYPGVIWVDTFGGLGGFTDEIDPEDFALGTVRSDAHASYKGAEKVAQMLRPAFAEAVPVATYGTPLFSVSKDRPATDYVSLNPTLSGVNASPTSGITGQIPLNHVVNASPTLIGSTLSVVASLSQDDDGENVVTFTLTGENPSQTVVRMYSTSTRVLPTLEELTGKCFAGAGTINVSEISKFKGAGIYVALTGGGVTRNFHAAQQAGTDGSAVPYNVSGPRELRCVTPMGKLTPTANPTNVSLNFTFTIPVGTYSGETISVKRMAAGFAPAADYVAP